MAKMNPFAKKGADKAGKKGAKPEAGKKGKGGFPFALFGKGKGKK